MIMDMRVLDYFSDPQGHSSDGDIVEVEYRLLASGPLFNAEVPTSDWSKTDAARILLQAPFNLFVSSRPFDSYPQEIALRFYAGMVKEQNKNRIRIFRPDDEIAKDICALLCLLFRRLITPFSKVREMSKEAIGPQDFRDFPAPIFQEMKPVFWPRLPATMISSGSEIRELTDYNPAPKPIESSKIASVLQNLPNSEYGQSLVRAARFYALALELIEGRTAIAYQLFIWSLETIANEVKKDFVPGEEAVLESKRGVKKLALEFGLDEKMAGELAFEATRGMAWTKRKLLSFVGDYLDVEKLVPDDDLFNWDETLGPKTMPEILKSLSRIYNVRSGNLHSGSRFPVQQPISRGPVPSQEISQHYFSESVIPPIEWMERITNLSINGLIQKSL